MSSSEEKSRSKPGKCGNREGLSLESPSRFSLIDKRSVFDCARKSASFRAAIKKLSCKFNYYFTSGSRVITFGRGGRTTEAGPSALHEVQRLSLLVMPSPIFVLVCAFFAAACIVAAISLTIHLTQWVRIGYGMMRQNSGRRPVWE
jgi:hypothetical protein